ncbi:MAG: enoyl-CoA hydratase/isomerase family protein [Myxococcota bacterium]
MSSVLLQKEGPAALLILNRPDVKNAVDLATMDALRAAVDKLADDKDVRAVIFTGAGEEAFCAGGDLKAFQALDSAESGRAMSLKMQEALAALEDLSVPVIGVLNGYAMGGGCEAFMATDIRVAESHAYLAWKQLQFGVIAGWGAFARLVRDVGERRAMRMLLFREQLSAEQAREAGLVDEVVEKGQGLARARELAAQIAENAPIAVRMLKRTMRELSPPPRMELQARLFATSWGSRDHAEAVAAFFERRPPRWEDR